MSLSAKKYQKKLGPENLRNQNEKLSGKNS